MTRTAMTRGDEHECPGTDGASVDELSVSAALADFKRAMAFRRRANAALRPLGVSFAEWRVLEATWRLIRRTGDAVGQRQVARDLWLDETSVDRLMVALRTRGMLDHGIGGRNGAYRIYLTSRAKQLLGPAYTLVAQASRAR